MDFGYSEAVRAAFPELASAALLVGGITPEGDVTAPIQPLTAVATARLGSGTESELPEIQAWRRTFTRMGLKPTQYRCASEALLRRFRKEGTLPQIHPLIDLCNAASLAFAIPVAVFDMAAVKGRLEVCQAGGNEVYESFSGERETPAPGEIIFADEAGNAHARRWTNRQSRLSAIGPGTTRALIVAEALHDTAREDVARLIAALEAALSETWKVQILGRRQLSAR